MIRELWGLGKSPNPVLPTTTSFPTGTDVTSDWEIVIIQDIK